ncbi:MAG: VWA domain-containing protein [Clostridia bacterium]|nr:VWA domain-containing protein [Clostridia bacterium]
MMANIKIKNKKVLAVIIAFAMVLGLVAPAVFVFGADTHLIGSDTQSGENGATTFVKGLETAKTADDLGDGQYRINLAAKATSATLTPTATDFELVLDMSGSMNDTLYSRNYKNLKNHVNFKSVAVSSVTHDWLYDPDNPDNAKNAGFFEAIGDIGRTKTYQKNKYVMDPNKPDTYVYLAQNFTHKDGVWKGLSLQEKAVNTYTYTITDSDGNIYDSEPFVFEYNDGVLVNSINLLAIINSKISGPIKFHIRTPAEGAVDYFEVDTFYTREKADSYANDYTSKQLYDIANSKGLYIIDDEGQKRRVFIETRHDNPTDDRITDYVYYITADDTANGTRIYETHQGNMTFGSDYTVFQGFKNLVYTIDENTGTKVFPVNSRGEHLVDHANSIEHKTLYSGEKENVTNLLALQESLETFLIAVHRDAADKGVDQRVGISTFNNDSSTKLSINNANSHVMYEAMANQVIQKVYSLDAHNGTRVDLGMKKAQTEFTNYSVPLGRKTVAIVFTDGKPSESLGSDFSLSKANAAIKTSNQMKTQLGTEVYTVGMLKYADENQLHGDTYFHFDWRGTGKNNVPCNGNVGSSWGATWSSTWTQQTDASGPIDAGAINRFLNYLSSNSPDATDLGLSQVTALFQQGWKVKKNYTVNQEPPHYFAVSTATFGGYNEDGTMKPDVVTSPEELNADLINAFHQIAESVKVPSTVIDGTTILHDTITPYFDYVEGSVKVTEDGVDITNQVNVTVDPETGLVEVTGYDYGANVNKELVVSFLVRRGEDFIGGQNVPTNEIDAGIYDKDRLLEANFPVPLVDVPLQFNNAVTGQSVYYSYEADLTKLINTNTLNGVNNDFADVVFTITDNHGNTVGTYTVPAGESNGSWNDGFNAENAYPQVYEDTQYSVTYVVSDTEETLTDTADAMVYVWVPEITVADGETTVGNREDITPELTWVPAGNHNASEIPALDETADPQVSYKVKDADTNAEITDLDNHLFTANQNFQVYDVTLADRTFVYYTTHIQQATENVYDDNGNITGTNPVVDDDGNPVMEEVVVEHQLDRTAADVTAATKFVNKTNADDQTPSEYEWTLSKYSLVIGTEFAGDYANPEDVTYTVTDEDGTVVGTASFSKDDFTGLKTDKTVTIEDLAPGKNYTVTKTSGAEKYIVTFTAKDANDAAVADADSDDANQVFGLNYNDSAETVNLFITNTFDEQYNPPVSGVDGGTNLAKLVATIMFVLAGILGVCEVSYIAYLRIRA